MAHRELAELKRLVQDMQPCHGLVIIHLDAVEILLAPDLIDWCKTTFPTAVTSTGTHAFSISGPMTKYVLEIYTHGRTDAWTQKADGTLDTLAIDAF